MIFWCVMMVIRDAKAANSSTGTTAFPPPDRKKTKFFVLFLYTLIIYNVLHNTNATLFTDLLMYTIMTAIFIKVVNTCICPHVAN